MVSIVCFVLCALCFVLCALCLSEDYGSYSLNHLITHLINQSINLRRKYSEYCLSMLSLGGLLLYACKTRAMNYHLAVSLTIHLIIHLTIYLTTNLLIVDHESSVTTTSCVRSSICRLAINV